jgi:hypothetical protein
MSRRRFGVRYSLILDKSIGLTVRVSLRSATYIGWLVGVTSAVCVRAAVPRAGYVRGETVRRCDLHGGYNVFENTHPPARTQGRRQPVWGEFDQRRRILHWTRAWEYLTGGSSRSWSTAAGFLAVATR